ncbi:phosphopantetheine-binding protein [Streptococcus suis]|nr:phosphopantetheine-binding protein [Streptococcus suis]
MNEKLIKILEELQPEVDFTTCTNLIDEHYLDSLTIISLVTELEEEFNITIPTVEIIPQNFNSAQEIWTMITRLQEEE